MRKSFKNINYTVRYAAFRNLRCIGSHYEFKNQCLLNYNLSHSMMKNFHRTFSAGSWWKGKYPSALEESNPLRVELTSDSDVRNFSVSSNGLKMVPLEAAMYSKKDEEAKSKNEEAKSKKEKRSKFYSNTWKFFGLPLSAAISGYLADGRMKAREQKLAEIKKMMEDIDKHRTATQEFFSNLDSVEIIPRLAAYTFAKEKEIEEKYIKNSKNFLIMMRKTEDFLSRIDRIIKQIKAGWPLYCLKEGFYDSCFYINFHPEEYPRLYKKHSKLFMTEVYFLAKECEKILKEKKLELNVVFYINKAIMHLKLKEFDPALESIEKAIEHIGEEAIKKIREKEIESEEEKVLIAEEEKALKDLSNAKEKGIKDVKEEARKEEKEKAVALEKIREKAVKLCDEKFLKFSYIHACVLRGKIYYSRAIFRSSEQDLVRAQDNFSTIITHPPLEEKDFDTSIFPLAHCYKGYILSERGNHDDEAIKEHSEANRLAPSTYSTLDGLGYGIYMLSRAIQDEIDNADKSDKDSIKKICEKHQKSFKALGFSIKQETQINKEELVIGLAQIALEKFNRAIAIRPEHNTVALTRRAWLWLNIGDNLVEQPDKKKDMYSNALKDFDLAIENSEDKHYPLARAGRALALCKLLKYREDDSKSNDLEIMVEEMITDFKIAEAFYNTLPGVTNGTPNNILCSIKIIKKALDEIKNKVKEYEEKKPSEKRNHRRVELFRPAPLIKQDSMREYSKPGCRT